jgi:DNA-binding response OmpR family regulator
LNAAATGDGLPSALAKTLLVVEDNVLVRHAVADALRYAGYTVLEASTAEEAKAVLTAVSVDLVFTDLNIPTEGEGFSVAQFARECCPGMPLIFTSGRVAAPMRARLKEFGPFLPKPYLISKLVEIIGEKLSDKTE